MIKMENFKKIYKIDKEIFLQSKAENNKLFVYYND